MQPVDCKGFVVVHLCIELVESGEVAAASWAFVHNHFVAEDMAAAVLAGLCFENTYSYYYTQEAEDGTTDEVLVCIAPWAQRHAEPVLHKLEQNVRGLLELLGHAVCSMLPLAAVVAFLGQVIDSQKLISNSSAGQMVQYTSVE